MKKLLLFLFFSASLLSAQPTIEWQKTYGGSSFDESQSIQQTSDGGYITAGKSGSADGDIFGHRGGFDIWVLKLSNSGSIQWKKTLGGTGTDIAYTVYQTYDGGYLVSGHTSSNNFDVSGNHGGNYDGWAVKLSSTGNIEWQKTLGGSNWDALWSSKQTADHGYILAGKSRSSDGDVPANQGLFDFWVVKLSETGSIEWQKTYGGSMDDLGQSVIQTEDGGYLVAGETASTDGDVTDLHGNIDIWLIKLSAAGELEWQKTYGGSAWDTSSEVIQASDGGYVVAGYSGSNDGDVTGHHYSFDYWVIKVSSTGELEWQKNLGGSEPDWGRAIVPSADGGYVVAGTTHSSNGDIVGNDGGAEFWVLKLSQTGELLWQQTYGGTKADEGFSIGNTTDNGFILSGFAWSNDGDLAGSENKGYNDYCIIKLSPEPVSATETPGTNPGHLEIYPNPASQYISLRVAPEATALTVSVTNMLGMELIRKKITTDGQIDISALPGGLYIVQALTAEGKAFLGKFDRR